MWEVRKWPPLLPLIDGVGAGCAQDYDVHTRRGWMTTYVPPETGTTG
jgi:hypothetical protein